MFWRNRYRRNINIPEEQIAGIAVYNPTIDRFLILARRPLTRDGSWVFDLPKGHVETGETLQQAALRECFEETGLVPQILGNFNITFKVDNRSYFFFFGVVSTTQVELSNEHQAFAWKTADFATYLPPPLDTVLQAAEIFVQMHPFE